MYSKIQLYVYVLLIINMLACALVSITIYNILCSSHYEVYSSLVIDRLDTDFLVLFFTIPYEVVQSSTSYIHLQFDCTSYVSHFFFDTTSLWLFCGSFTSFLSTFECTDLFFISIRFLTRTPNTTSIEFICLQDILHISTCETALFFFRITNTENSSIQCITFYLVYPTKWTPYITKLQCFCFDLLVLTSNESVDLPVLIYIENNMFDVPSNMLDNVYFFYTLLVV